MIAEWAALLVEATLKTSVGIGIAGLLTLSLSRRSAALRHMVWATAIVGTLLLPALAVIAPRWPISVGGGWQPLTAWFQPESIPGPGGSRIEPPSRQGSAAARQDGVTPDSAKQGTLPEPVATERAGAAPAAATDPPSRQRWDAARLLVVLWSGGALVAFAPLALALVRIRQIVRLSRPVDAARWCALVGRVAEFHGLSAAGLAVRRAEGPITPLTWGIFRPVVVLPASCDAWSDAQAYEVLVHEAGHVRRHDCLTQYLASAACVLQWWNPLVWLAAGRMLVERERACDDHVLQAGARPSDYAGNLLELARSLGAPWSTSHVTTAMARRSQISGRLLAILDPDLRRGTVRRQAALASAALALLVLVPLGGATLVPSTDAERPGGLAPERLTPQPTPAGMVRGPGALDVPTIGRELRARQRDYAATLERGDLEALAAFYTVDVRVAGPSLPIAVGRGGVRSLLQHLIDAGVKRVELESEELYPVGDLLCETGTARLMRASGAPFAVTHYMTLWKNEDGTWRIHRDWSSH